MRFRERNSAVSLQGNSGGVNSSSSRANTEQEALNKPFVLTQPSRPFVPLEFILRDETTDQITPSYVSKVREGSPLPVNPMSRLITYVSGEITFDLRVRGIQKTSTRWDVYDRWHNVSFAPAIVKGQLPEIDADALLIEAVADWRSQDMDQGTFLAELGKTVAMIRNLPNTLNRAINQVVREMRRRKGNKGKSVVELMSLFSSLWMEGRYGWRLLYYDILDIQESLDRLQGLEKAQLRSSKTKTETRRTNHAYQQSGYLRYRLVTDVQSTVRAGCGGSFSVGSGGHFDPLVTAYEVFPLTMVLDWIVNVGSNLRALSPFGKGDLQWSWASRRDIHTTYVEWAPEWGTFSEYGSGNVTPSMLSIVEEYNRNPLDVNLAFSFDTGFGGLKTLDAAAIVMLISRGLYKKLRLLSI